MVDCKEVWINLKGFRKVWGERGWIVVFKRFSGGCGFIVWDVGVDLRSFLWGLRAFGKLGLFRVGSCWKIWGCLR